MSATNAKTTWRRDMRQLRNRRGPQASPPRVHELTASGIWASASTIASYCQAGSEQTPSLIEEAAKKAGKAIVYPRVIGAGKMVFKAPVPRSSFEIGRYGIAEPPATAETIDVAKIDLFLVPLLACDQYGTRLGYGGGYYDRLLEQAPGFRCGLGFGFQRVADLPRERHDVRMQGLLTDLEFEIYTAN